MEKYILLISIVLISYLTSAQLNKDSILMNERTIDRPLTLHKGQVQINSAYDISILSKKFDADGNKLDLETQGTASVLHKYLFEFNYGILDFLQASIAINYNKRGERKENTIIYSYETEPYLDISYFDEYKGFEDIYVGMIIKLPLKSDKFEFAIAPGIYLPLFSIEPKEPEHTITYPSVDQPFTKINYHNHHKFGNGAMAVKLGALTKIKASNDISISAQFNYTAPLSESESVFWIYQLDGSSFVYEKIPYKYLISNKLDYEINLGYQAISWFNVSLAYKARQHTAGWSEETSLRIGNLETKLSLISIGYEIKAKMIGNPLVSPPTIANFGEGFPERIGNIQTKWYVRKVAHTINNTGYFMDVDIVDAFAISPTGEVL